MYQNSNCSITLRNDEQNSHKKNNKKTVIFSKNTTISSLLPTKRQRVHEIGERERITMQDDERHRVNERTESDCESEDKDEDRSGLLLKRSH